MKWRETARIDPQKLVGPLFSALYALDPAVKWHAVTCFGFLVPRIRNEKSLEAARVIMRRFLWNLNDESGGIGWGSPEAMGEIMACDPVMADEYHCLLLSFIEDRQGPDNYLEHLPLREGAYWGIARLAQSSPGLVQPRADHLLQSAQNEESLMCRVLAGLALTCLPESRHLLAPSIAPDDADAAVTIYWNRRFQALSLNQLGQGAFNPTPL
jgi:hypothetical protein